MLKLKGLACATALLGVASGLQAQETMTTSHLAIVDKNGDGQVDAGEFRKFMEVTFTTLDVNKDGQLEWTEVKEILPVAAFKAADANGNNALGAKEFTVQVTKDFAGADLDGDGKLN